MTTKSKIIDFGTPNTQPAHRNKSTRRQYKPTPAVSNKPYTVADDNGAPLAAYLAVYGCSMMRDPQQWGLWKRAMNITDEQVTDALNLLREQGREMLQYKRIA
jgi:hypothetical protein